MHFQKWERTVVRWYNFLIFFLSDLSFSPLFLSLVLFDLSTFSLFFFASLSPSFSYQAFFFFFFFLLQINTGVEIGMQILLSDWLRSKIFRTCVAVCWLSLGVSPCVDCRCGFGLGFNVGFPLCCCFCLIVV